MSEMTEEKIIEILKEADVGNVFPVIWQYLVKLEVPQKLKSDMIYIPDNDVTTVRAMTATVLRVGELCNFNHAPAGQTGRPVAKPGDKVHISMNAGTTLRNSLNKLTTIRYVEDDCIKGLVKEF